MRVGSKGAVIERGEAEGVATDGPGLRVRWAGLICAESSGNRRGRDRQRSRSWTGECPDTSNKEILDTLKSTARSDGRLLSRSVGRSVVRRMTRHTEPEVKVCACVCMCV